MRAQGHKWIRRLLPVGMTLLINLCLGAALSHLLHSSETREQQFAVELQASPSAKQQQVQTILPPPPRHIVAMKKHAEKILQQQENAPEKLDKRERELLDTVPAIPPPSTPAQEQIRQTTPAKSDTPESADNKVEYPLEPAPLAPRVAVGIPGAGNINADISPNPASGNAGTGSGGNAGGGDAHGDGHGKGTGNGEGGGDTGGAPPGTGGSGIAGNGHSGDPGGPGNGAGPGDDGHPGSDGNGGKTNNEPAGNGGTGTPHGEVSRGGVKSRPQPAYPADARDDGVQGIVRLSVTVNADGKVIGDPVLVSSSGSKSLDSAARKGVKKWSFTPDVVDGKPVTSTFTVDVKFELH